MTNPPDATATTPPISDEQLAQWEQDAQTIYRDSKAAVFGEAWDNERILCLIPEVRRLHAELARRPADVQGGK